MLAQHCIALHYVTLRCIALHYTTRVRKFASSAGTLFHYITLNTSQYNHFVQVLFTPCGYHQIKKQDTGDRRQETGEVTSASQDWICHPWKVTWQFLTVF